MPAWSHAGVETVRLCFAGIGRGIQEVWTIVDGGQVWVDRAPRRHAIDWIHLLLFPSTASEQIGPVVHAELDQFDSRGTYSST
jgi:hypothetical protein